MEVVGILYIAGLIIAIVLLALLFWAPMKPYAIHKELHMLNANFLIYAKRMRDSQDAQTKLLATMANARNPTEHNLLAEEQPPS